MHRLRLTDRPASARWRRWTARYGFPSAVVALASAWLYQPRTTTQGAIATALALAAVATFVATMPAGRSRRSSTGEHTIRDAVVTVADADPGPDGTTPSDTYELRVFGVSVLVRVRADWEGQPSVPYVHIEHQADRPRLLLVEVDNDGESEHR